ncbi:hypothetical protein P9222_24650 [Paenibacillus amylolyticus]|nr:hypothetical protein [Paenibacillus amylolyticus]WFR61574.1 hypothetical protein P9222_24650 [Paenibacillus amylolyticus]
MSFKIRTVLTVIFAVLSLLVTLTIGSIFSQKSFGAVETEIGHSLTGTASQASDKLDRFMAARAGELDLLGRMASIEDGFRPDEIQMLLDQLQDSFPSFSWVGFMDPKGKVLAATDGILLGKIYLSDLCIRKGSRVSSLEMCIMQYFSPSCYQIQRESRCNLSISVFR